VSLGPGFPSLCPEFRCRSLVRNHTENDENTGDEVGQRRKIEKYITQLARTYSKGPKQHNYENILVGLPPAACRPMEQRMDISKLSLNRDSDAKTPAE
jgi:hypothetical protein